MTDRVLGTLESPLVDAFGPSSGTTDRALGGCQDAAKVKLASEILGH
jgi:hypothetical protein